ncbi:MAG TPA: hypothetical protein VKG26_03515 [Bacteroidia bacterium]|nr:hypothetical protein [Bacteroidia bacterium]
MQPTKAQTIKVDFDSVIVYCKYNDLMQAIKKINRYSEAIHWEGHKKIVERDPPYYLDSLKTLKKLSPDTITLSTDLWSGDMDMETDRLAKKYKLIYFDRRNHKLVTHVKKTVTGKKGEMLFYIFIDADTKNQLYSIVKKNWLKF